MFGWSGAEWFSILTGAAVKGSGVLAAAWVAGWLLRRRSAALRHLVWTAAFAAILALPFLSAALPALRVPGTGAVLPPQGGNFQTTATMAGGAGTGSAVDGGGIAVGTLRRGWLPDWRMYLLLGWAAGAGVALARTLVAYAAARQVRRSGGPFPDRDLCATLARSLGIRRAVDVIGIDAGSMPMTFGARRAVVLMPADACIWSEEKLRMVLLHELAHVRRGDAATHLLGRAAMALYWWNPLAWSAWREFLKERERAADDLVLNAGERPPEYAGQLLEVARGVRSSSVMGWATASMARRSQLEGRLLAILDSGVNRTAPGRASVMAAVLLAAAMIVPLAAIRAQEGAVAGVPADVDAAILAAHVQQNFQALDVAAQSATRLGEYDTARKLLKGALAVRGEAAGELSVEYGVGLVKLAEAEQKVDVKSGGDLYAQAAQILGERREAARALTHLGLAALEKRDFAGAFEYFQKLQRAAPAQAGTALMWMAVVRQEEKNFDEADLLYGSAIAAEDPHSVDAAVIMQVYATFLRAQGRADQAGEFEMRSAPIRKAHAKPAAGLPAGVYRIGKGMAAPTVLSKIEPQYTDEARAARFQGTVVLQIVVGTDGLVHDVHLLRGLGLGLDENAIEAVNRWRFKPGAKDGQPVKVLATIEVQYRLF